MAISLDRPQVRPSPPAWASAVATSEKRHFLSRVIGQSLMQQLLLSEDLGRRLGTVSTEYLPASAGVSLLHSHHREFHACSSDATRLARTPISWGRPCPRSRHCAKGQQLHLVAVPLSLSDFAGAGEASTVSRPWGTWTEEFGW